MEVSTAVLVGAIFYSPPKLRFQKLDQRNYETNQRHHEFLHPCLPVGPSKRPRGASSAETRCHDI